MTYLLFKSNCQKFCSCLYCALVCPLRAVNCGAALATEAPNLMAQTRNVIRTGYWCVCVCVCDTSVGTLLFATAVNNKPQITKQNIVRIRRIIFIFLPKYLSHDRLNDCVMTQLSSQFVSHNFRVLAFQSLHLLASDIRYHRRHYGYVSPL